MWMYLIYGHSRSYTTANSYTVVYSTRSTELNEARRSPEPHKNTRSNGVPKEPLLRVASDGKRYSIAKSDQRRAVRTGKCASCKMEGKARDRNNSSLSRMMPDMYRGGGSLNDERWTQCMVEAGREQDI